MKSFFSPNLRKSLKHILHVYDLTEFYGSVLSVSIIIYDRNCLSVNNLCQSAPMNYPAAELRGIQNVTFCHSGLPGIFPKRDSLRTLFAGMTAHTDPDAEHRGIPLIKL